MPSEAKSLFKPQRVGDSPSVLLPSLVQQHLWFKLSAQKAWTSLALVPAEDDVTTATLAQSMGRLAAEKPGSRVLVVNASLKDCRPPRTQPVAVEMFIDGLAHAEPLAPNCDFVDFSSLHIEDAERALHLAPQLLDYMAAEGTVYTSALFAVDSLLHHTRAIPLVRSLDAVALCLTLGQTTFAAARQLIEIVGRDRVAGAIPVRL